MLEVDIKHVAFILPENEWAKMAMDEYTEDSGKKGMIITYFKDVESAKNWFRAITDISYYQNKLNNSKA